MVGREADQSTRVVIAAPAMPAVAEMPILLAATPKSAIAIGISAWSVRLFSEPTRPRYSGAIVDWNAPESIAEAAPAVSPTTPAETIMTPRDGMPIAAAAPP